MTGVFAAATAAYLLPTSSSKACSSWPWERCSFAPEPVWARSSAGVFHHSGLKIPNFAFFAHDSGKRVKEAPWFMMTAMVVMAFGCILMGVYPEILYRVLPYPMEYHPYTTTHVITQYQLLLFSALAFVFLQKTGLYPPELRSVNLDFDWTYRRALPIAVGWTVRVGRVVTGAIMAPIRGLLHRTYRLVYRLHGPEGVFARTWTTGSIAFWAVVVLCGYLLYFFGR